MGNRKPASDKLYITCPMCGRLATLQKLGEPIRSYSWRDLIKIKVKQFFGYRGINWFPMQANERTVAIIHNLIVDKLDILNILFNSPSRSFEIATSASKHYEYNMPNRGIEGIFRGVRE